MLGGGLPSDMKSARFALTLSIVCCHVCRLRACVCVCVWVRAMVNNHFAISLDEQISHILYYFFCSFISCRCVRACFPRPFDFSQHHFSSSTMRMNDAPIPPYPIWSISSAVKSFSLVRTTELPKRAANEARNANGCVWVCKWRCILYFVPSLVANDSVHCMCFLMQPHTSAKWCRILLIDQKYQADSVHQFLLPLLPVTYASMPIVRVAGCFHPQSHTSSVMVDAGRLPSPHCQRTKIKDHSTAYSIVTHISHVRTSHHCLRNMNVFR